jgi:hypothetical protein
VRFEVHTAMSVGFAVFKDVRSCSLVGGYRRFEGTCCFHLQGIKANVLPFIYWFILHFSNNAFSMSSNHKIIFPDDYSLILSLDYVWCDILNALLEQEVLGRTNRLFSLIRHGPHWKRRFQQYFYCCVCIRYRDNISTEPLPSNDRGISTEPLSSNDREIFTEPLPSNDRDIHI